MTTTPIIMMDFAMALACAMLAIEYYKKKSYGMAMVFSFMVGLFFAMAIDMILFTIA